MLERIAKENQNTCIDFELVWTQNHIKFILLCVWCVYSLSILKYFISYSILYSSLIWSNPSQTHFLVLVIFRTFGFSYSFCTSILIHSIQSDGKDKKKVHWQTCRWNDPKWKIHCFSWLVCFVSKMLLPCEIPFLMWANVKGSKTIAMSKRI